MLTSIVARGFDPCYRAPEHRVKPDIFLIVLGGVCDCEWFVFACLSTVYKWGLARSRYFVIRGQVLCYTCDENKIRSVKLMFKAFGNKGPSWPYGVFLESG